MRTIEHNKSRPSLRHDIHLQPPIKCLFFTADGVASSRRKTGNLNPLLLVVERETLQMLSSVLCNWITVALLLPLGGVESFLSTISPHPNLASFSCAATIANRENTPHGKSFSITFEDYKDREMRYKTEQDSRDSNNKMLAEVVSDIKQHENIEKDKNFSVAVVETVWEAIRADAQYIAVMDVAASSVMTTCVICQPSFKEAVISRVANLLETPLLQATQIRNIFDDVIQQRPEILSYLALDIIASSTRSGEKPTPTRVLLFSRGFHSLVAHRISNILWETGRTEMAKFFQSAVSKCFLSDIHPACRIGHGCYISTGTSVVLGETCVVGNDVFISHGVTLGGTGKVAGDRHPKIGDGVVLGAGCTVLGNTKVGPGAIVSAGSVVNKDVLAFTRVEGVPAKLVAKLRPKGKFLAYGFLANGVSQESKTYMDLLEAQVNKELEKTPLTDISEIAIDYDFYEFLPKDYGY